ncbi:MAG: dihydroorotase [Anaerolineae bacterium]
MPLLRLPGLIDVHVHLREPGAPHKEDFESGTKAALAGGITTVLAMPNTHPPIIDDAALTLAEQAAQARACCDYGIYLGASSENITTAPTLAPRTCGMKFYLDATFGSLLIKDLTTIREHFARFPKDRPIVCHAEGRAVAVVILCAQLENRSVHIAHVSRQEEIELIRDAKQRGLRVTCEVAPHHLFLTELDAARIGAGRSEVRPRLNTPADQAALWENFAYIDCIATDHAPHLLSEKDSDHPPPGFPGLETALPLLLTAIHQNRLSLETVIAWMYHNPKRIFNLPDQPDTFIEIDTDADWQPSFENTVSRARWTPFATWSLRGRVEAVTLRGREVYRGGIFTTNPGSGKNVAPIAQ